MTKIQIRHLQNQEEFDALDSLYQMCFGEHSVPTARQHEWWLAAPTHIIGLFIDDLIYGGISFWAIKTAIFDILSTGQLKERDITISNFKLENKQLYYLSDIAIAKQYRQKQYANLLLAQAFKQIGIGHNDNFPIKILAFAFSEGGKKILTGLGFEKIKDATETLDEQDLMLLLIHNQQEIDILISRLN